MVRWRECEGVGGGNGTGSQIMQGPRDDPRRSWAPFPGSGEEVAGLMPHGKRRPWALGSVGHP